MAWIESHEELGQHPKLLRLARQLDIPRAQAIGHLQYLWWWAVKYAGEGDLSGMVASEIAEACTWDGDPEAFVEALTMSGFLDRDGDNLVIHDWSDYAGRLIQKRQANAERMRLARALHVQNTNGARAGATLPDPTLPDHTVPILSQAVTQTAWAPPKFFMSLISLDGYKKTNHGRAADTIKATCEAQEVDPAQVVSDFADYYKGNRFRHGWTDPVAVLIKTLPVQISKIKKGSGSARASPNEDFHARRIRAEKAIPLRKAEEI